jgi:hypothetical protein
MGLIRSITMKRKPTNPNISFGNNLDNSNKIGSGYDVENSIDFHSPVHTKLSGILKGVTLDPPSPGRKLSNNTGVDTTAGNNSNQKLKNQPTLMLDSEISPKGIFFPINRKENHQNPKNPNPLKIHHQAPPESQNPSPRRGFLAF